LAEADRDRGKRKGKRKRVDVKRWWRRKNKDEYLATVTAKYKGVQLCQKIH
jgi:hypothetical protein